MIKVYSKPNCVQCNFTKKYLDDKKIPYTVIDVTRDASALDYVRELGFQSLPVVEAEDMDAFNGFRPELLAKLGDGADELD